MQTFLNYCVRNAPLIIDALAQHIQMVALSMSISIALGLAIGIMCTYHKGLENFFMPLTQVMMVIPSLALMGVLIPILGIGFYNAIACLIIYSLLPIVKNTITGIRSIPHEIIEAANGMGIKEKRILLLVKLPLASPVIMAGIRSAIVMLVGIATIMSQVGAGGLGRIVFRGVDQANMPAIIIGALLVSILAILIDRIFVLFQKLLQNKTSV